MTEPLTIVQCQRIIGTLDAQIAKLIAAADVADQRAEFAAPGSDTLRSYRAQSRTIRQVSLPWLYTKLHHYQSRLPEQQADRSEAITRRLLGLSLIA